MGIKGFVIFCCVVVVVTCASICQGGVSGSGFVRRGVSPKSMAKKVSSQALPCQNGNGKIVLDFEGLGDNELILPTAYQACGVSFSKNALSLMDYDTGSGSFRNEPSAHTVLLFYDETGTVNSTQLNSSTGITGGLSFYYCSFAADGYVKVYSGSNGSGTVLTTLTLPPTTDGASGLCDVWKNIGVSFSGIAQSIDFGGVDNGIAFDNITLNSSVATGSLSGVGSVGAYSSATSDSTTGAGSYAPRANNPSIVAGQVNSASGSLLLERTIATTGGMSSLTLTIRYDSLLLATDAFGNGWHHNYETWLEVLAPAHNNVRIHWDANHSNTFANDGFNTFSSTDLANSAIRYDTLIKNDDLSYTLLRKNGVVLTFAPNGTLLRQTQPGGQVVNVTYGANGRLSTLTDPVTGAAVMFTYLANGLVDHVTDTSKRTTAFTYDSRGNLTKITDNHGQTTTFTSNGEGRVVTGSDAEGRVLFTNDFDTQGRVASHSNEFGITSRFTYDEATLPGYIVTSVTTGGEVRVATHDNSYNLVALKDELGAVTTYTYDVAGNRLSVTDPKNNRTNYGYDSRGHLISLSDPKKGTVTQSFDASGNLLSQSDPNNNRTTFLYDVFNRLTGITTASGGNSIFTSGNGLLSTVRNARGNLSSYSWYDNGYIKSVSDLVGTITSTYDAHGNLLTATENGSTLTYRYDALDRLISHTDGSGNVLQYAFDRNGNLATLVYPDGKTVSYGYDSGNRLVKVTDWVGRVTAYTYDAAGRLAITGKPDGSLETRFYTPTGKLAQLKILGADGTTVIGNSTFTYDGTGNLTGETTADGDPDYTLFSTLMTYGADNRLTSYQGLPIGYDADGNMLTAPLGVALYEHLYDSRNRLTSVAGTSYRYDSFNHRTGVTTPAGDTHSVINPASATEQILMERNSTNGVAVWYVYGLGMISREDSADNSFKVYHHDRNGNTVALTDSLGTVTDAYRYAPYGELLKRSGNTPNRFLYRGRDGVVTDDNGLLRMGTRYYNPMVRRFLTVDVASDGIGDGQSLNRYTYRPGSR